MEGVSSVREFYNSEVKLVLLVYLLDSSFALSLANVTS